MAASVLLLIPATLWAQEWVRTYVETRGSTRSPVEYRLASGDDHTWVLSTAGADTADTVRWRSGVGTIEWRMKAHESELSASRTADVIHVSGTLRGRQVDRQLKVDAAPWYQVFGPLMDELLPAGSAGREFWVVDPADLSVHKMQVKRLGMERITLAGAAVEAERIHFSPAGALAPFWGADFWYRPSDGLYLASRLPEHGGLIVTTIEDPAR